MKPGFKGDGPKHLHAIGYGSEEIRRCPAFPLAVTARSPRRQYQGPRPYGPERHVLEEASLAAFAPMTPDAGTVRWDVTDRIIRAYSTIFVVTFMCGRTQSRAFYKEFHCPRKSEEENSWRHELGAALTRSHVLTMRFNELSQKDGVRLAPVLSVDSSKAISVTQAMPGRVLGQFRWPGLTRGQREKVLEIHRRVGQATYLLESTSDSLADSLDPGMEQLQTWVLPERILTLAEHISSFTKRDLMKLQLEVEKLYAELLSSDNAFIYAHNDLSNSNILVDGQRLGLIDATFLPRYRGYDLAKYAFRLEYQGRSLTAWTTRLVEALIEGYGDESLATRAAWKVVRLRSLLQLLNRPSASKHRAMRRKALKEIGSYL